MDSSYFKWVLRNAWENFFNQDINLLTCFSKPHFKVECTGILSAHASYYVHRCLIYLSIWRIPKCFFTEHFLHPLVLIDSYVCSCSSVISIHWSNHGIEWTWPKNPSLPVLWKLSGVKQKSHSFSVQTQYFPSFLLIKYHQYPYDS